MVKEPGFRSWNPALALSKPKKSNSVRNFLKRINGKSGQNLDYNRGIRWDTQVSHGYHPTQVPFALSGTLTTGEHTLARFVLLRRYGEVSCGRNSTGSTGSPG